MAAPTSTARQTPTGRRLDDGHVSLITFARFPAVKFWETEIEPPGIDGGDPKDITSFHETEFRIKRPRKLKEYTDGSIKAFYDPSVIDTIEEMINEEDTITIRYADGTTRYFFGYMKDFKEDALKEGEPPSAKITFVSTAYDHTNAVEAQQVLTSVAGT